METDEVRIVRLFLHLEISRAFKTVSYREAHTCVKIHTQVHTHGNTQAHTNMYTHISIHMNTHEHTNAHSPVYTHKN